MLFKRLKDKKGVAIESAVLFMVTIFSFCFLLSGLTIGAHYRAKVESIKMEQKLEDEMILDRAIDEYLIFLSNLEIPEKTASEGEAGGEGNQGEDNNAQASADITSDVPLISLLEGGDADSENGNTENSEETTKTDTIKFLTEYIKENPELFSFMLSKGYTAVDTHSFDKGTGVAQFFLTVKKGDTDVLYASFQKLNSVPTKIIHIEKYPKVNSDAAEN